MPTPRFAPPDDDDEDDETEDAPLVGTPYDSDARREARERNATDFWFDDAADNVRLVVMLLASLGLGMLGGFYGFDGLVKLVTRLQCGKAAPHVARPTPRAPATAAQDEAESPVGHEWLGGAVGGAELPGRSERWGPGQQEPRNSSLLLLGVLSGSRNFDQRDWLRRGYWAQRAWRRGVEWRFVVGRELPKGDNNRVSLEYEEQRYRDIDIVSGSELPPAQAVKGLSWLLKVARDAQRSPQAAPVFVGLSSDAVLLSLPHVAVSLRPLVRRRWAPRPGAPAGDTSTRRYVYAGALRWATMPLALGGSSGGGGATAGTAWRCVQATTAAALLDARLAGDAPSTAAAPAAGSRAALGRSGARAACGDGAQDAAFLAAGPELSILDAGLLARVAPELDQLLEPKLAAQLNVEPSAKQWQRHPEKRGEPHGHTPAEPALVTAIAAASLVQRAAVAARLPLTLTHLDLHSVESTYGFSWEGGPPPVGARTLLARGLDDALQAEVAFDVMSRQRVRPPQLQCSASRCKGWALTGTSAPPLCCA